MANFFEFKKDAPRPAPKHAGKVRSQMASKGLTPKEIDVLMEAMGLTPQPGKMRAFLRETDWDRIVARCKTYLTIGACPPLKLKPKMHVGTMLIATACWSFSKGKGLSDAVHRIYLGKDLFAWDDKGSARFQADKGLTEEEVQAYVFAHLAHEAGHGCVSEREPEKTKAMLEEVKCKFKVKRPVKLELTEEVPTLENQESDREDDPDDSDAQADAEGDTTQVEGSLGEVEQEEVEVVGPCPFPLYNLMEDAWMEAWVRLKMSGCTLDSSVRKMTLLNAGESWKFNWLKLEIPAWSQCKAAAESPSMGGAPAEAMSIQKGLKGQAVLFSLIQTEGDVALVREGWSDQVETQADQETLDWVIDYYERLLSGMLAAQAAREEAGSPLEWGEGQNPMVGFLQEWVDRFPMDGKPQKGSQSDLEAGAALSELSEDDLKELESSLKELRDKQEGKAGGSSGEKAPGDHVFRDPTEFNLVAKDRRPVLDMKKELPLQEIKWGRVGRMAGTLKKLFKQRPKGVWRDDPGHHGELDAGRLLEFRTQETPWFVRCVPGAKGLKKVLVVMDQSGSMGSKTTLKDGTETTHTNEGVHFLAALSELARSGILEGHVVFSAIVDGEASYQTFKLPLSSETLSIVQGMHCGEGLDHSMKSNEALLREADTVFVYTDAQIGDLSIDKEGWAKRGVKPIGLYVGSREGGRYVESCETKLKAFFGRAVVRSCMEEVLEMMIAQKMM